MALGASAALAVTKYLNDTLKNQAEARVVFACAPSQDDFLAALVARHRTHGEVDWERVTVFHMDEYLGLPRGHPQHFRNYLEQHLLRHIRVAQFYPILADGNGRSDYATQVMEKPVDLICMGIGENGHIAFNDPPLADFEDRAWGRVVELDPACRQQQVNDGCFPRLEDVPRRAYTLTIPVFRQAKRLNLHVPGVRKAAAVRAALLGPITPACPASIVRPHENATLYLDPDSASLL